MKAMVRAIGYQSGTGWARRMAVVLAVLAIVGTGSAGQKKEKLADRYRKWLDQDVVYIITKVERDAFLHLVTDEDRDKFIANFWEIRNPAPGSASNSFKDEHYQRIAYANDHFGHESGNAGWRTDMGRTYIVLGPPKQKSTYHDSQSLRPMEVWFYSNGNPALPPFFYLLFYREDNFSEYKLYSPYFDGPEKLVTTRGDTRLQAWQRIDKNGGRELARVALSLLPDEPVDTQNAVASMDSDMMLAKLRDLANNPLSVEDLNLKRMRNSVTSTMIMRGDTLGALLLPTRMSSGETRVDYAIHLARAEDFSLAESEGKRYYFKIAVRAEVYNKEHNLLFTQERTYTKYLSSDQVERIKSRVFSYEGTLPLPPGSYHVEFQLNDLVKRTGYRTQQDVTVPEIPAKKLEVTGIVPFVAVKQIGAGEEDTVPFGFGGVQFTPLLKREANYAPGQQLKFFYQIWRANAPGSRDLSSLKVHYTYGRPGGRMEAEFVDEEVSGGQFDQNGSLLNGKELALGEWAPGNYKLVMTLTDPRTSDQAFGNLDFRFVPGLSPALPWGIDDREDTAKDQKSGALDYRRGLCFISSGNIEAANNAFQRALQKEPGNQLALTALIDAAYSRKAYDQVARYAVQLKLTEKTDERTILHIGEGFAETNAPDKGIQFLESALTTHPNSGPICITLGKLYARAGSLEKAHLMEEKGRKLMTDSRSQN